MSAPATSIEAGESFSSVSSFVPTTIPRERLLTTAEAGLNLLDCSQCVTESTALCVSSWDFLENQDNIVALNQGRTLFAFECCTGASLTEPLKTIIERHVNITGFQDEEKENHSIPINVRDPDQANKYTYIVTKVAYLLPGIQLSDLTPELFGSTKYHETCQPGKPTIWDDCTDPTTFRITKTIIPYVFKITIQLKASLVSPAAKVRVEELERRPIGKLVVLERTKRNTTVADMTYKCKAFMAYNAVKTGVYVSHTTVVLNTMIPSYGTWILNNMGSFGSKESCLTAELTRKNLPALLVARAEGSVQESKVEKVTAVDPKKKKKSFIGRG
jgi:hypothetical protein